MLYSAFPSSVAALRRVDCLSVLGNPSSGAELRRMDSAACPPHEFPLQRPAVGKMPLMKRKFSSATGSRSDNTPKWVDIQTCIITSANHRQPEAIEGAT